MSSTAFKDYKPIIAELQRQDWDVQQTSQGHWRAAPPDKTKPVIHFSTSDDPHAFMNTVRDLKRCGLIWPPPSKNEQKKANGTGPLTQKLDFTGVLGKLEALKSEPELPKDVVEDIAPLETEEARMDRLFKELKEAKTYVALAEEHERECRAKALAAERELEKAVKEAEAAAAALSEKKRAFDAAFSSAA